MSIEFITFLQKVIYLGVTVFLCLFLYLYIYHMYYMQRNNKVDYEKYSRLALDDNLDSDIIESRK